VNGKSAFLFGALVTLAVSVWLLMPESVAADFDYVVQPGDTLTHIANRFGTSVAAIVQANEISDPNLILIGQLLHIPAAGDGDATTSSMTMPVESLVVADFDNCAGTNNLGGLMGAAFQIPGNKLDESYVSDGEHGCVARLEYEIGDWAAFWLKLEDLQLNSFRDDNGVLTLDIRADEPLPNGVKIELKRFCLPNEGCAELSVYYMTAITTDWQRRSIPLEGFGSTGWSAPLSSWEGIEELAFTFEARNPGNNGIIFLDNIMLAR
jgi:murein DD-endopeptidase MepM/ murein hydrolase activator NlpD